MHIQFFLPFLVLSSAHIPLGSLSGFLTLSEISDRMSWLVGNYSQLSRSSSSGLDTLSSSSSSLDTRPLILVLGGFYGGYPMGNFMALQVAEELLSRNAANDTSAATILGNFRLAFVPVLNTAAYEYMEAQWPNSSFTEVKTDLSGNTSNCSAGSYDVGIDPYFNFPFQFVPGTDPCDNKYAGQSSLESNVSKTVYNAIFGATPPALIINFHSYGKKMLTPWAYSAMWLDMYSEDFYEVPDAEGLDEGSSYNVTNTAKFGTFMDCAFNMGTQYVEFMLGSSAEIDEGDIYSTADARVDDWISLMLAMGPEPSFDFTDNNVDQDSCDSDCMFYGTVTFKIEGENKGLGNYTYSAVFTPNFTNNSNFQPVNVTATYTFPDDSTEEVSVNFNVLTTDNNTDVAFSDVIYGFSSVDLRVIYQQIVDGDVDYTPTATFKATKFEMADIVVPMTHEDSSSGGGGPKKGVVVGLVLLLVLIILFAIAAVALYCTRKPKDVPPVGQGQRA
jgi:hypothetical protein